MKMKSDIIEDISFLLYFIPIILTAGSFIWKITENNSQIKILTQIRDALLIELMLGGKLV